MWTPRATRQILGIISFLILFGMIWDWERDQVAVFFVLARCGNFASFDYLALIFGGSVLLELKNTWKWWTYILSYFILGYISFVIALFMCAVLIPQNGYIAWDFSLFHILWGRMVAGAIIPIGMIYGVMKGLINMGITWGWKRVSGNMQ